MTRSSAQTTSASMSAPMLFRRSSTAFLHSAHAFHQHEETASTTPELCKASSEPGLLDESVVVTLSVRWHASAGHQHHH